MTAPWRSSQREMGIAAALVVLAIALLALSKLL
jgi:hypothetical protein